LHTDDTSLTHTYIHTETSLVDTHLRLHTDDTSLTHTYIHTEMSLAH